MAPQTNNSRPLEGWFHPGQVQSTTDQNNTFALRVLVSTQNYDQMLKQFQGNQRTGKVTIQPYKSDNVPGVVGARIDGEVSQKKQGSMIMMPFRDKTLQIWTESVDFKGDFDNIILKNFTFTP